MQDSAPQPPPQPWQSLVDPDLDATIYQRGQHSAGTFIRVYVPRAAQCAGEPLRVILYLHGFALGLPCFYEAHLRELVQQGWVVIFPDFQFSAYPDTPLAAVSGSVPSSGSDHQAPRWAATTWRLLRRSGDRLLEADDLPPELAETITAPGRPEARAGDLRRVLLPWILIQLVLWVIGWFRRTYARNLSKLLGTVLFSLAYPPTTWLVNAVSQAEAALDDLAQLPPYRHWSTQPLSAYTFGHSLGGLLSLSIPSLQGDQAPRRLQPRVVLAADPATSTTMGIPAFAIALLRLFDAPFTRDPISIDTTGAALRQPVAILHGMADDLVKPQLWATGKGGGAFRFIASTAKALYFSESNTALTPPLIACHNEAVTSTQYYNDALFESFGGVKNGPNAYNTSWIWPALTALFTEVTTPSDLLDHLPQPPFRVTTEPPAAR
ncbi:MAG: hypothetical protein RLZZ516_1168 [Cyanobacteriota bacterium]|jgi:hypothetical protein|nr:hypothetical protein [Synechococcaceae bacterium WB4_1_0192]